VCKHDAVKAQFDALLVRVVAAGGGQLHALAVLVRGTYWIGDWFGP
jgi:hypothetical protein